MTSVISCGIVDERVSAAGVNSGFQRNTYVTAFYPADRNDQRASCAAFFAAIDSAITHFTQPVQAAKPRQLHRRSRAFHDRSLAGFLEYEGDCYPIDGVGSTRQ